MNDTVMAIPSHAPGGLDAEVSRHFGKSACFTVVEVADDAIVGVDVLPGIPHGSGGCMTPVRYLVNHGARTLIAGGMGARPLRGLRAAGVEVLSAPDAGTVGDAVGSAIRGDLPRFGAEAVCGGP
jgi:predicted Fe-Mo cluster-binding NifX family protein